MKELAEAVVTQAKGMKGFQYMTLTLFPASEVAPRAAEFVSNLAALNEYAFLYTVTEKGNATGIRFMATADDARKWCSSDLSRGTLHGTAWMYFFTDVGTYLVNRLGWQPGCGRPSMRLFLDPLADNGAWDDRVASTGCRMIRIPHIADVLRPLGVSIEYTTP